MSLFKSPEETSPAERWTIAFTVVFGAFMAVMDTSVVNVSMPHMMGSFGTDLSAVTWVATSYSIAEIIMVTMSGWWSALLGRKNFYLASFALFTVGSVLCGTATTFPQMIIYRVIQGIGGGALIPVSQAILRETFPPAQQGIAMALYGMGVVLAPALGPICGGWLTDMWGWPWIFYINVPVCAVGMVLTMKFVHDPPYLRRGIRFVDWLGIGLLTVFLTGMQVVLERGQEEQWFDSTLIRYWTVATLLSLVVLIFWEWRCKEPVVNLRVFKDKNLVLGSVMGLIFGVSLFGTTFVLPQFTQKILGYPAFESGLALAPRAMVLMIFMPVAGWAYQKVGAKPLVMAGITIIVWSYYDLMQLSVQAGFFDLVPPLLIMGVGMPFMFVPLSTVSLCTVDRSLVTDASSIYTLARRVGGNIGYSLVAVLLDRGITSHRTYLADHVSALDPTSQEYLAKLAQALQAKGASALQASQLALGLLEKKLMRQATMLAYNDISFIFGCLFFLLVPMVFYLPGKAQVLALAGKKKSKS
ncbi:DHA2 family efflux MFS transporter permease subunit [Pseudodesulfovibrio cashew]|uniref:DHA2 family efflux MFS transporter permease subunit n=1 Tax=Pseudodesulfovibrio cashew TaxID=2678688 RepID=A0A6I6JCJ6_9BACT|nr:DHA2 family efflux MFS transporter permease subunit [Pseudodesulfovibrio cashew]QGY40516.1 DHA2 family efflux MFS transporter permease subunit [Pseudodesulfovibrio cashew]